MIKPSYLLSNVAVSVQRHPGFANSQEALSFASDLMQTAFAPPYDRFTHMSAVGLALEAGDHKQAKSFLRRRPTPELIKEALDRGNQSYIHSISGTPEQRIESFEGALRRAVHSESRLAILKEIGQAPLATIISCSDSGVVPGRIFSMGIGDLFKSQVAGNVCDTDEIGTAQLGDINLAPPLLFVMGHTHCALVEAARHPELLSGPLHELALKASPALAAAQDGDHVIADELQEHEAEIKNVWLQIGTIFDQLPDILQRIISGDLLVEGALYHTESGQVTWLGPHPELLSLIGR